MGGTPTPQSSMSMPQQQDAFGTSIAQQIWPGSGMQGAMTSPYLPIVQPLMQNYDNAISALMPQSQNLGPVSIQPVAPKPGQGESDRSSIGALMTLVDPVGGTTFGGNGPK